MNNVKATVVASISMLALLDACGATQSNPNVHEIPFTVKGELPFSVFDEGQEQLRTTVPRKAAEICPGEFTISDVETGKTVAAGDGESMTTLIAKVICK